MTEDLEWKEREREERAWVRQVKAGEREERAREKEERKQEREEEKSDKALEKSQERVEKSIDSAASGVAGGIARGFSKLLVRGTSKSPLPRGIRHPDTLVKNKGLYFGTGSSEKFTPLGRRMTDWRELYFGSGPVKVDATKVANALGKGASDVDSLAVYTGLSEKKVVSALKFLKRQGYDVDYTGE